LLLRCFEVVLRRDHGGHPGPRAVVKGEADKDIGFHDPFPRVIGRQRGIKAGARLLCRDGALPSRQDRDVDGGSAGPQATAQHGDKLVCGAVSGLAIVAMRRRAQCAEYGPGLEHGLGQMAMQVKGDSDWRVRTHDVAHSNKEIGIGLYAKTIDL
jgi:hypothetical protein